MIEKYPAIDSSNETGASGEIPFSGEVCVGAISRLVSDKDKLAAAITPLEGPVISRPKASTPLEIWNLPVQGQFHRRNNHIPYNQLSA